MKQTETPMCKNVATACSVVVLAFGLAACSSSSDNRQEMGGDDPPTPPAEVANPELKQQQDAAAEAAAGAGAASKLAAEGMAAAGDAPAKTGSEAAQTAVMGLVSVQLPAKAKMYADEAKAAAEAAKRAYDTAKKAESAAAAATSLSVATEARLDAEAARKEAEAQAEIANKKAKQAVDAAGPGIKYADGTYTVGAMSIMPGTERITKTVDGKSMTVGLLGSDDGIGKKTVSRKDPEEPHEDKVVTTDVTHMVADRRERIESTIRADRTPLGGILGSPEIPAGREIRVSNMYDSEDDKSRLWLVTHYMGKASIGVFYRPDAPVIATVDQEPDAPYGRWDTDDTGNKYGDGEKKIVQKVDGKFHLAEPGSVTRTGTGSRIWNGTIHTMNVVIGDEEEILEEGEIFFVYDNRTDYSSSATSDRRTWLELVATINKPDGTKSFQYKMIHAWTGDYAGNPEKISVSDFPESIAYDHVNFGLWSMLDGAGKKPKELGIAFAMAKQDGSMTADMPASGTATYNGSWAAHVRGRAIVSGSGGATNNPAPITEQSGNSVVTADFAKDTVKVELHQLATLEGMISGNMFSGTKISDVKAKKGNLVAAADGSGFTGEFSGSFFGSDAEEVGGVFDYTSENRMKGEFRGAFGGSKSGMPMAEMISVVGGAEPGPPKEIRRRIDIPDIPE